MRGGKILILISALIAMSASVFAQTPLGFNYQGVARSADGSPLINQFIGLRVSITSGPSGSIDYIEDHHPETNEFGLFNIIVGQGQSSGNIADVNWGEGNKWLQIEIDPEDNANYILVGSQQMMSVPYSLYAAKSGEALNAGIGIDISNGQISNVLPDQTVSLIGSGAATVTGTYPNFEVDVANIDDADADPANEIQTLSKAGNTVTLSNSGGSFIDEVADADADSINEIQTLESVLMVGADAGGVAITNLADPAIAQDAATKSYVDAQDALDLDKDATNEIQTLTKTGSTVTLSNSGGSFTDEVDDADADSANELQDISTSGAAGNISLSNGSDINLNVDDADANSTNEIQTLSKLGSTVTLSNSGGSFTDEVVDADNDPANEIQTISKTGSTVTLSNSGGSFIDEVADADADATNEIQMLTDVLAEGADAGGVAITNLADPASAQDAATKNYVDAQDGLDLDKSTINEIQNLTSVLAEGTNAGAAAITNLADPTNAQDAATKNYVDTQDATLAVTITSNTTDISTEVAGRQTGDTALQSELDLTQTGSGLNADGTFTADPTTTYLQTSTTLMQSNKLLDTQLAANTGAISANSIAVSAETTSRTTADGAIQAELDGTQIGSGLGVDGAYIQDATTNYISGATSLQNANKIIDDKVKLNEIGVASNSSDIVSLNTAVNNTYAFKVPISATTSLDLNFDFSAWTINENITISGNSISIIEPGIYTFIIKGSSNLIAPSDMYLTVNSTDHLVKIDNFSYYSDTFLFQLNATDVIGLKIVSGGFSEVFDIEFFGYKL